MRKIFLIFGVLLSRIFSSAAIQEMVDVRGVLTKVEKDFIYVKSPSGQNKTVTMKIPAKFSPSTEGLVIGKAQVTVHIPFLELKSMIFDSKN